ncbi:phosphatase inhibitor-domain-containing protein [Cantharellus anzutake]|uniref:phosphatase inhibitor-domain-containing protein n=1 Tax=Cantharellus anzutake TaxID=1750568 RepID=UPI0019038A0B|nr:phosphatase inhibitor-domain-containing protein [Cantharellus anzutake]KAF8340327.1 phosphatase inhibitor-domain-containing protein [Cantharellus anzutake]
MLAQRPRPQHTGVMPDGSRTITIHDVSAPEVSYHDVGSHPRPVLRLRGGPRRQQRVVWKEGTIDNENCGRKKSKICCIYHKPKRFDESSDESSGESDSGRAKPIRRARLPHHHDHSPNEGPNETSSSSAGGESSAERQGSGSATMTELQDALLSHNAYEVQSGRKDFKGKAPA